MQYKVIPFPKSQNINKTLEDILQANAVDGWEYTNHKYEHYLMPGSAGCFGIGAKSDTIWHVGHVVFQKK